MNGQAVEIRRPRQRAVLAYLLLNANKVISVNHLTEALWGGAEPSTARTQVQGDISALRRAFRMVRVSPPVHTRTPGYSITVGDGQLDIEVFQRYIADARSEYDHGNWETGVRLVRSGLELWRGTPLSDLTASYVEPAQSQLLELKLNAAELLAELYFGLGDYVTAAAEITPIVAAYPLHEELRRKLMLALFRNGRQTEALRHARELRAELAEQQGLTPGRSFIKLEEAILRGDPSLDVHTPSQSMHFSPKPVAAPTQLPSTPSDFTGRAEYLEALDKLAFPAVSSANPATVIALVGPAGVGKTALAVHWAHRTIDRFPDGQLYINLRGYDPRRSVTSLEALSRMLRGLGLAAEAIPSDLEDSANLFRSVVASKRMLVVLDNALSADQVRPLLSASQDTLTLITSRSKLTGLAVREGARRLTIKALATDESLTLLGRILGPERLRAESEEAAELAQACNRLPLALRIAAANIANQTAPRIAEFVRELAASDVLTALQVTGDEETSIQSVFDQSYTTVSETTRRCLRMLGLIPGPDFPMEAVSALTGTDLPETRQLINQLLEAHLVDEPAAGRYTMHDLLRAYARKRTKMEDSEKDRAEARERLLDWYLRSADNATRLMFPQWVRLAIPDSVTARQPITFEDSSEAISWLDGEYPNLLAALREAADTPHAWLLADSLRGYFFVRRLRTDWITAAGTALAAATAHRRPHAELASRLGLAQAYQWLGDHPRALQQYESALRLARRIGKSDAEIACQGNVGSILVETGELVRAIPHLQEALAVGADASQNPNQLVTLSAIGTAYQHLGQLPIAVEIHRRALALAGAVESISSEAYASANLGTALQAVGDLEEAESHIEHAIVLLRRLGDHDVESACLSELAAVHLDAGDIAKARHRAEEAWELSRTVESPHWAIPVLSMLATVRHDLDEHEHAIRLAHEKGTPEFIARTLLAAARTAAQVGATEFGSVKANGALQVATRLGYRVIEGNASIVLGELELAAGRLDPAIEHAQAALTIHKETGHRLGEIRARAVLDQAHTQPGPTDDAGPR
ncbi:MAG: tetratricopeptide repeat protein [Actinoallomurus sp.]